MYLPEAKLGSALGAMGELDADAVEVIGHKSLLVTAHRLIMYHVGLLRSSD